MSNLVVILTFLKVSDIHIISALNTETVSLKMHFVTKNKLNNFIERLIDPGFES